MIKMTLFTKQFSVINLPSAKETAGFDAKKMESITAAFRSGRFIKGAEVIGLLDGEKGMTAEELDSVVAASKKVWLTFSKETIDFLRKQTLPNNSSESPRGKPRGITQSNYVALSSLALGAL